MIYQTLEEHLERILSATCLGKQEKEIMTTLYLNPGMSTSNILKASKANQLEDLRQQGLLFIHQSETEEHLFPAPLAILYKQKGEPKDDSTLIHCVDSLKVLDKWMKYPAMKEKEARLKISTETDMALKWLFDLHQTDWETVYCFGDYESFIADMGIDPEVDWIKERAKKKRGAMVLATQDGEWAQRIESLQQEELRDCCIDPGKFSDLFIMAFPEIYTTVIAGKNNEMTFIHSKEISEHYAGVVKEGVLTNRIS